MVEAMGDGLEVPTEFVPRCPHCGAEAFPWVRGYGNFLQGELYEEQYRKVSDWARRARAADDPFPRAGRGPHDACVYPGAGFWALTARCRGCYSREQQDAFSPSIEDRGLAVRADIADVLADVRKTLGR